MLKKYFVPILLLLVIGYFISRFLYYKNQLSSLPYGVKANDLRQRLHIPIIDNYMKAEKFGSIGSRWESKEDLPSGNNILHVWKVIIPLSDTAGLYEESDAFRKRFNDSLIYQLNIHSKIIGDTLATRKGKIFSLNQSSLFDLDLTDDKIDSVVNSWGLTYLNRNR